MKAGGLGLRSDVFARGQRVLVALSGGVDSLALLHCLVAWQRELQIELRAVHVHHGMRGDAADADVEFLRRTCTAWGAPLTVVYREVPALATERGVGVEEAGRIARYEAFAEVAREHGCPQVATAHHADDQVETLLLHLLRGTGLDGLRGMPERRPLSPAPDAPELIRPLLAVWRHELEAYCREHRLEPRHDSTNDDPHYRRNRIRQELVPLLDSLAPSARQNLLRLTRHAAAEVEVLEPIARELLGRARAPVESLAGISQVPEWLVGRQPPHFPAIEVGPLSLAPTASVRRAVRLWLREALHDGTELSLELVDRILSLAGEGEERPEKAVDLPDCGLRIRRMGSRLRIEQQQKDAAPPSPIHIPAPGIYPLVDFGLKLVVAEADPPDDPRLSADQACLDLAAVAWPLRIRAPVAGDRLRTLGASGSRLLSDLFIDRKIPAEARASWPLVEDREGLLWVCGLAVAERGRVTPDTARVLLLQVAPLPVAAGEVASNHQVERP